MLKKFLLAASIIAMPAVASAADMAVKAAPYIAAPAYNWTGFYAGIVGGGGMAQMSSPSYYYPYYYGNITDQGWGGTFGGTVGYNFQSGNFVFGIEGDISWSGLKVDNHDNYYGGGYYGTKGSWDAIATIRGRAGLAINNTLAYVTGGLALVDVKQQWCYSGVNGCGSYGGVYDVANKGWQTGFAAGAGVEHAITNNLRFKAEYLYIGLPNKSQTSPYAAQYNYGAVNFSSSAHLGRIGLNMNF
jgi:outer membrane immunogenic protein